MAETYRNLYDRLCSFENLLLAGKKAQKGKKFKENTARFNFYLEPELLRLQDELLSQTYQPGKYRKFVVYDPKRRLISAAPYRDRVVHHALCNIIQPLLEKSFIFDTYANRIGKGTHKAIIRCQEFSRKNKYVLKFDIVKYFDSIDRKILFQTVARKIRDEKVLWLVRQILALSKNYLDDSNQPSLFPDVKGMPIGNLTSQFFANLYLDGFDHFVKERLGCRYYIRYVDDFVILDDDKKKLREIRNKVEGYLAGIHLKIHPGKTQIFPVMQGVEFLGFRIFPTHRLLKKQNFFHYRRHLKCLHKLYTEGNLSFAKLKQSVDSWVAHVRWGDTWGLRKKLFAEFPMSI
ncbi:MAG: reverse transcriptase/maturase family protein [Candidatus Omnitrophota bacterium]